MIIKFPENLIKRKILLQITPFLKQENIILLSGPRQTGKTSLLYLLIKKLLKQGVIQSQIVYFDLEDVLVLDRINNLKGFDKFLDLLEREGANVSKRIFVFIDEIQYLNHPSSFLKYLHDHYKPKIKFIVSGSSSLEIKRKFTDRLTGRVYPFIVLPLDFEEFLFFKQKKTFSLNLWKEFCLFGGYPAVVLRKEQFVKEKELAGIYSLYVKRDIKDFGGIEDVLGFNKLVKLLSLQIGNLFSESELAVSVQLSRQTIRKYLFLLENTYVIKRLLPFFTNKRKEFVKMPKVYFFDSGLRNAVLGSFSQIEQRGDIGHLMENLIFHELYKKVFEKQAELRFWRAQTGQEVDFVWQKKTGEIIPIEVKYRNFTKPVLNRGIKQFIKKYQPKQAVMITKDFEDKINFKKTEILFLPAYKIMDFIRKML